MVIALDFGVENDVYKKALEDLRNIKLPETYWTEVADLIEEESEKASKAVNNLRVDDALMHRCFSL